MSKDLRIFEYAKAMRMVAFCNVLLTLAKTTDVFMIAVRKHEERFMHTLANKGLIDDEIKEYLNDDRACALVIAFADANGYVANKDAFQVVRAMADAMKNDLISRWASLDVVNVSVIYKGKLNTEVTDERWDMVEARTLNEDELAVKYQLNPLNKRGAALNKAIHSTIREVAGIK